MSKSDSHPDNFAVFIITHGRPNNIKTTTTVRNAGYTGPIFYIVDNEDDTIAEYQKLYGDAVKIFDKKAWADKIDEMDNFDKRRTTAHARNASFSIAKELGYRWFVQFDDDYTNFQFRITGSGQYPDHLLGTKYLNKVFHAFVEFLKATNCTSVAMAQGGDFIGGKNNKPFAAEPKMRRKCMNSFFCDSERPFTFRGRLNEDVNTYVALGNIGELFCTIPFFSLNQASTQQSSGGMSDAYLESGTYQKSFYTVMLCPSAVKVSMLNTTNRRIHHKICWRDAVPLILREEIRKQAKNPPHIATPKIASSKRKQ
jgi:hypothetical protein